MGPKMATVLDMGPLGCQLRSLFSWGPFLVAFLDHIWGPFFGPILVHGEPAISIGVPVGGTVRM